MQRSRKGSEIESTVV